MNTSLPRMNRIALSVALLCAQAVFAAPSQTPLLTRGSMVPPNIVFMVDDSGSMGATYLYQEATPAAWGYTSISSLNISSGYGVKPNNPGYALCSPQINQLYYDPSTYYPPPFDNTGNRLAPAAVLNTSSGWGSSSDGVCLSSSGAGNPAVYNYKGGNGPYWNGTLVLNPSSATASYTPVYITPATASYTKFTGRTDCAGTTCTYAEESQNFANWYKWYRTRLLMAKSSIKEAFANLPATFRLGWGKLSTLANSKVLTEGVSLYDSAKRTKFIDFVDAMGTSGETPSRWALDTVGKYYMRQDTDGPWSNSPVTTSTGITTVSGKTVTNPNATFATCRRANAIYITDGYYNDKSTSGMSGTIVGEVDGSTSITTLPDGTAYAPENPYKQAGASDTFADVAMKYWITDLFPTLDNKIKKVTGDNLDPATWQHMNFWAIGLGVIGTIDISTPDKQKTELDAIKLPDTAPGHKSWPVPVENQPSTLDDMWHATINARGGFLNAGNTKELQAAINSMMGQMLKASSSQAGVAVSTASLDTGTAKYVPTYTTGNWSGNLIAYQLNNVAPNPALPISTSNPAIGQVIMPALWQAETIDATTELETANTLCPYPSDTAKCPASLTVANTVTRAANRNIFVGNGATSGTRAVPFTYSDMNGASLISSITPAYIGQIVDDTLIKFLRGDKTEEGTSGTTRAYRSRFTTLGDIVNSTPNFVKYANDYGYSSLPGYTNFLATKAGRTEGAIFFGANDGMVHALAESNGREVFAYVPKAVLPKIAKLAVASYGTSNDHQYFVDGPMSQGDYYSTSANAWRNVVLGTTGAGAKAVFALNVTNPISMNASSVLWEISNTTSGFSELGNVLHDVQIGKMRDGSWAAIFGNGYDSASQRAMLFIVSMDTGALLKVIDTQAGSSATPNGLGGVRLVKNSAGEVIGAYAGDLLGNMWKFDLYDTNTSNWGTGYGTASAPKPLYIAKNSAGATQPITAMPYVLPHPSGGYVVVMSTGKLFEDADLSDTIVQSTYGIRDTQLFGTTPIPNPSGASKVVGTTTLVKQLITAVNTINQTVTAFDGTTSTQAITFYSISSNSVDWNSKDGWYFNLPNSGQRTVYPVDAFVSSVPRLVRVDTVQPGGVASDPCATATSAVGATYLIDGLTGGSPQGTFLDTNNDGSVIDGTVAGAVNPDVANASGYTTAADGRNIAIVRPASSTITNIDTYDCSSVGECKPVPIPICTFGWASTPVEIQSCCNQGGKNASYYCSLTTQTKRTWRQLFMR